MELRQQIEAALKQAMRDREAVRLSTLRLITAAIKDRDIAWRAKGGDAADSGVGSEGILEILGKMVKQRHESVRAYEEGGRVELAERERLEISVIEEFLPRRLDEAETEAAVQAAVDETGASSIRDVGKVMAALKARYAGRMDFGAVGSKVRERLG